MDPKTLPQMPEPKDAAGWRYRPADASDDWRLIAQPWEEELHSARWEHEPLFTAAQLRAYGAACYAAGMDRAAEVCEAKAQAAWSWWDARADPADQGAAMAADELADAIRAAKGE